MSWISTNNLRRFADKLFHGNLSFGGSVTHNGATTFNGGVKVNTTKAEFAAPVSFTGTTTYKGNEVVTKNEIDGVLKNPEDWYELTSQSNLMNFYLMGVYGVENYGKISSFTYTDIIKSNLDNFYAAKSDTYTKAEVDNKLSGGSSILEKVYPVGSIYMNATDSRNPAQIFGFGTWEQIAAGRVLIGAGKADSGTAYKAGDKGGAEKVPLSIDNIPAHTHSATIASAGNHTHEMYKGDDNASSSGYGAMKEMYRYTRETHEIPWAGNHTHSITINNTGRDQPHNNMQPYIAVYIFKRTA